MALKAIIGRGTARLDYNLRVPAAPEPGRSDVEIEVRMIEVSISRPYPMSDPRLVVSMYGNVIRKDGTPGSRQSWTNVQPWSAIPAHGREVLRRQLVEHAAQQRADLDAFETLLATVTP